MSDLCAGAEAGEYPENRAKHFPPSRSQGGGQSKTGNFHPPDTLCRKTIRTGAVLNFPTYTLREEENADADAISEVHRAAFEGPAEANLVLELRAEALALASHVGLEGEQVVAHALYSRMHVDTPDGPVPVVALGPIGVVPERQRQGLGGAVIRAGLAAIRASGERLILVLGHPAYYPRFGFDAAVGKRISAPWSGPPWMGMDLQGEPIKGRARYPEPWSRVD